jgi:hypothetical protein
MTVTPGAVRALEREALRSEPEGSPAGARSAESRPGGPGVRGSDGRESHRLGPSECQWLGLGPGGARAPGPQAARRIDSTPAVI